MDVNIVILVTSMFKVFTELYTTSIYPMSGVNMSTLICSNLVQAKQPSQQGRKRILCRSWYQAMLKNMLNPLLAVIMLQKRNFWLLITRYDILHEAQLSQMVADTILSVPETYCTRLWPSDSSITSTHVDKAFSLSDLHIWHESSDFVSMISRLIY